MSEMFLSGQVTDGLGEGKEFVSLSGYVDQFEVKLGYKPFPGTLNVSLDAESTSRRSQLGEYTGIRITEWESGDRTYGAATCYPATVTVPGGGTADQVHLIVPDRTRHSDAEIELVAPSRLRDELDLMDGQQITVRVTDSQ